MSTSPSDRWNTLARAVRGPAVFTATLLAVELLDELVYGVQGTALPLIRDDLALDYVQVGLLLTVPGLIGNVLDPLIGLLGDVWRRKALIVVGALATALAMLLVAAGHTFPALLVAFCVSYPASTAYVSLSQATLMDLNPGRHDQMMARWTVLGSLGQLAGPALVTAAVAAGVGWRNVYLVLAALALLVALAFVRQRFDGGRHADEPREDFRRIMRALPGTIRRSGVLRWIVLIDLADLLLDVFYSFCALYFTDVAGASQELAGVAVLVLTAGGLLGDVLLIPLLERVDGLRVVRTSAAAVLVLYVAFLLVPGLWAKLALLALIGPLRSGWYQVLQGRAYTALPGRSGTVIAIASLAGLGVALFPLALGAVAESYGLVWAMALLSIGPASLLLGLPRGR